MSNESNEEWARKKIEEDMKKKLTGKTTTQGTEISIEVDKGHIKEMVKEVMAEEDFPLAEKKIELYKQFGEKRFLDAEDKQELKTMLTEVINEAREIKNPQSAPSGSAPLSGQTVNQSSDLLKMSFPDYESMIQYLRKLERNKENPQSADAKLILNELFKRHFALRKEKNIPIGEQEMPKISDLTTKKKKSERGVGLEDV